MITYLYSFNEQLEENIERIYEADWRGNNIWYGVSTDKHLLDSVFGSMKKLEKLFFASGILQEGNNTRRAKFCIHGEGILPAIQHKYRHLDFKMKSYFVAAQIFSKHIQLTLHQVVKLALPKEDAATIVIQDEIIHMDDIYDSLCKNILANTQIDCEYNHCHIHNAHDAFESLQTCTSLRQNLKLYVFEILKMSEESLDLDCGKKLIINDECDCSIDIFLRDVIEVNLKSVIEDIATVKAASLTNKRIFGNYEVDYLFVLENPFGMPYNSVVYRVYTMGSRSQQKDARWKSPNTTDMAEVPMSTPFLTCLSYIIQAIPYRKSILCWIQIWKERIIL
ncbi:hypothetical protein INT47_005626 [Mucor saturninus]|uniref:Uncharacterized protein n=1 Tax=Mucor saturninus TaxID=64648 RepID=A0A8H7QM44_9FUNG|nr:hypothetical protein INT47_005626 [Mucor saturninus]